VIRVTRLIVDIDGQPSVHLFEVDPALAPDESEVEAWSEPRPMDPVLRVTPELAALQDLLAHTSK
jgi:hypothetical protein